MLRALSQQSRTARVASILAAQSPRKAISATLAPSSWAAIRSGQTAHTEHSNGVNLHAGGAGRPRLPGLFQSIASLTPTFQQQVRHAHQTRRYFACPPDTPAPYPHRDGRLVSPHILLDSVYKFVARSDEVDMWLWNKPGNKVGRVSVSDPRLQPSKEWMRKQIDGPNKLEWANIPRDETHKITFVPLEDPYSEDPLAVHSTTFTAGSKVESPQKIDSSLFGGPYWTAEMLGSRNDPKTRAALKKAKFRPSFDRTKKVGEYKRGPEHVLVYIARMEKEWALEMNRKRIQEQGGAEGGIISFS
ncbi:hypothetical protein V8E36_005952 [Tilletia maclaganii]